MKILILQVLNIYITEGKIRFLLLNENILIIIQMNLLMFNK